VERGGTPVAFVRQWRGFTDGHPRGFSATIETLAWIGSILLGIDHALRPQASIMSQLTWYITIGPHELGHVICIPFGTLLTFLGGTIWQLLPFAFLAAFTLWRHKRIGQAALFWTVVGHSFIDISVYAADAQERNLDLLFNLPKTSHDWWNILTMLNLLPYDNLIGALFASAGLMTIITAGGIAILSIWSLPRQGIGNTRYTGNFWVALSDSLQPSADQRAVVEV
ncbi:MAG: hypothetical protein AAF125_13315, partial [Chloroflexota bacterium]